MIFLRRLLATAIAVCCLLSQTNAAIYSIGYPAGTTTGPVISVNLPDDLPEIRGLIILGNGAGADETGVVNNAEMIAFARANGFGVLGLGRWGNLYTPSERDQFTTALATFAAQSGRSELVNVPWVAYGFSQGGGQAYSLNYYFPSRTIVMGLNKTGDSWLSDGNDTGPLNQSYGTRGPSPDAVKTPAMLVAGANDDPMRITNMTNAFNNNRPLGAPWAFMIEEGAAHEKGNAYSLMLPFLAEVIALRYPANQSPCNGPVTLLDMDQAPGWLIDRSTQASGSLQVQAQSAFNGNPLTLGWVPSQRTARFCQAFASYSKIGAPGTVLSPQFAPVALSYGPDLTGTTWSKIEYFDGNGKLGELTPSAGNVPTWTRTVNTDGYNATYGLVTLTDGVTQHYSPLQTLWVNGGSGFSIITGAPAANWVYRSSTDNTGNISGSWGTASNWSTNTVPSAQNLQANLSTIDFGATSTITLDGARTVGYIQFGDASGGQWTTFASGSSGSLSFNVSSGTAAIQIAPGTGQTVNFSGVSPTGSVPLDLIGNGNSSTPNTLIMSVASSYSGAITARNSLEWEMAPSSGAFGSAAQGTTISKGCSLAFGWSSGSITVPEPLTISGYGITAKPALRITTAAGSTVTLTGSLTFPDAVAVGVSSATSGIGLTFNGVMAATGSDRSLYIGYLKSQSGDSNVPPWGLDTGTLDDTAGVTQWGPVTFDSGVSYPANSQLGRVVLGLGWLRLQGAANRLPASACLVLDGAYATAVATLQSSKVSLMGISQELAGLDSYLGGNPGYLLSVAGGATTQANLVLNIPAGSSSVFGGMLGGSGANENNLALEKKGAGAFTLMGNNTYTGKTQIDGGTLSISNEAAIGTAPATLVPDQLSITGSSVLDIMQTVTGATLVSSGPAYSAPPALSFVGGTSDHGAQGVANLAIASIACSAQGSGYTSAPAVSIAAPNLPGGVQATAIAIVSGGKVTGITITQPGSGYTAAPTLTITGGGGTGASAAVTGFTLLGASVTDGGWRYTAAPSVVLGTGTITGALTTTDPVARTRPGCYADVYELSGAGVTSLTASGFDTYMYLYDQTLAQIAYNDDSPLGGTGSLITATLDPTKRYLVEITSWATSTTGTYTLTTTSGRLTPILTNWSSMPPQAILAATLSATQLGANRGITLGTGGGVISSAGAAAIAGPVAGPGGLTKSGAGTLTLSGSLSYAGPTSVSAGTLALSSAAVIPSGAALVVETGATVARGGDMALPAATTICRDASSAGAAVQVNGNLLLSGALVVELPGFAPALNTIIPLITAPSITGSFSSVLVPRLASGNAYTLEMSGTQVNLRVVGTSFDTALFRAGLISGTAPVLASHVTADADGDGLANLIEYVLGNSLNARAMEAPVAQLTSGQLTLSFTRDTRVTDASLYVEATSALNSPWTAIAQNVKGTGWTSTAVVSESPPDANGIENVAVTDTTSGAHRFIRLRAVYGP